MIACITNIETDHLDCYRDLDEIIESFKAFVALVPEHGTIIANGADANVTRAIEGAAAPIQTVAIDLPAYWRTRTLGQENGCCIGEVLREGESVALLRLSVPGLHNLFDATLAVAACAACGVDPAAAADAISRFTGVDRRMTEMGHYHGATIVDDYGHHPTEIRATLAALRAATSPNACCAFSSRTRPAARGFCSMISPPVLPMPMRRSCRTSISSATARPIAPASAARNWSGTSNSMAAKRDTCQSLNRSRNTFVPRLNPAI